MRFEEARRRLVRLSPPFPPGPAELEPTLLEGPGGPPGVVAVDEPVRLGAVLALIHPTQLGEAAVLLIERTSGEHRHAGEISFPGGRVDPDDQSVVDAALREAHEEVALDERQAGVTVVGELDAVDVRVSGFRVLPVVALAERVPVLVAAEREVAGIIEAPLRHFLPGARIEIIEEERSGRRLRYGAFRVRDRVVWGATARILGQLGAVIGPA